MSRPIHHLLLFALAFATGAVTLGWGSQVSALRAVEASFSRLVVAAALAPPYLIEPGSKPDEAWVARRLTPAPLTRGAQFLSIGDDAQRIFESTPPSAGDYAVILSQLQRQGHSKVAISLPMAWDDTDPIALAALDHQLGAFPLALCACPLARGISPQPIPPALARASVATASITGNPRLLPVVNRTANSSIMLGSERTLAGFTLLENEDPPDFARHLAGGALDVALLARWDDRVVLGFPLLVAMAHAQVSAEELIIELGKFIRLGENGAVIPIDAFGRFQLLPAVPAAKEELAAPVESLLEALVAEEKTNVAITPQRAPIILRDERSTSRGPEAGFAATLGDLIFALEASPLPTGRLVFKHPPRWAEAVLLVALAALSSLFLRLNRTSRSVAILLTAALTLIGLLVLGQQLHLMPSGLPSMMVLASGLLAGSRQRTATSQRA